MNKNTYEIIVDNIGTVHTGHSRDAASRAYHEYVRISKQGYGRGAGESVTWMKNGEIVKHHIGDINQEDES